MPKKNTSRFPSKGGESGFNALARLAGNLPMDQRRQLASSMGNIFGVTPGGPGTAQRMSDDFTGQSASQQAATSEKIQQLLSRMGLTGPVGRPPPATAPGIIGQPNAPIRVSNPNTFLGGAAPAPQLNLGSIGGTMGMTAPPASPPTLSQTVAGQQPAAPTTGGLPAVPGTGGATGAGTATPGTATPGTAASPTSAGNPAPIATGASSANTSPTIGTPTPARGATSNSLINTGPLQAPGVGLNQVQSAVTGSPTLTSNPVTEQQLFQQTYNPMINMAGQVDVQNQLAGSPGRSMVGGQFGEGGLMGTVMQQQANQAALQGGTAAQQAIQANLQQQLQGQQVMAGMDAAARQQAVQQANALLGPALSGAATGFQQGLGGMTRMPQFMG